MPNFSPQLLHEAYQMNDLDDRRAHMSFFTFPISFGKYLLNINKNTRHKAEPQETKHLKSDTLNPEGVYYLEKGKDEEST